MKKFMLKLLFRYFTAHVKPDFPATVEAFNAAFAEYLEPYQIDLLSRCFFDILYEELDIKATDFEESQGVSNHWITPEFLKKTKSMNDDVVFMTKHPDVDLPIVRRASQSVLFNERTDNDD